MATQASLINAPILPDKIQGTVIPDIAKASQINQAALPAAPAGLTSNTPAVASTVNDVAKWNVQPEETVSEQLDRILGKDSPLMQRGRARANEFSNSRGLINSSMANQAAEGSLYDVAFPIASQNANTFARAGEFNANAANAAKAQNAGLLTQTSQFNADSALRSSMANADAANRLQQQNIDVGTGNARQNANLLTQTSQFNADAATRSSMANADAANRLQQQNLEVATGNARQNATAQNAMTLADLDATVKTALAGADNATRVQLQNLSSAAQIDLANIESAYRTLMQTSASGQGLYSDVIRGITQSMLSTDLDPTAKATAINNYTAMLKSGMNFIGKMANLDLSSIVNFSVA